MENDERLYTKEEVKDLMRRRVERSHQAFFHRYNVENLQELDDLFEKVKKINKGEEEKKTIRAGIKIRNVIGLENVKSELFQIVAFLKKQTESETKTSKAFCFIGESGLGKSTMAKLFTSLLFENNLINKNETNFYNGDFVCKDDIEKMYKENEGGVVVIDDAHCLFESWNGGERVGLTAFLCEQIEKTKGKTITIFCDRPNYLSPMLKKNQRFSNTITKVINFEKYTQKEMMDLITQSLSKLGYYCNDDAVKEISKIVKCLSKLPNFAYGRSLKNFLEKVMVIQANRTSNKENDTEITIEDLKQYEKNEKLSRTVLDDDEKIYEKKLDALIGLDNVKKQIKRIKSYAIKNMDNSENLNLHMCFTGNPGTGKTEVAKLFAGILYEEGVLPENKLVQKTRSTLVGKYVGQTAPLVRDAVMEAMGGVLFIDEAYAIGSDVGVNEGYGSEAISELIKCMEDYRGQFAVIFAGYKNETLEMIESNPGLKSRINRYVDFEDYGKDDLIKICSFMLSREGYKASDKILTKLADIVLLKKDIKNYGNAREIRNVLESLYEIQALRTLDDKANKVLLLKDVDNYLKDNDIDLSKAKIIKQGISKSELANLPLNYKPDELTCNFIEDRVVAITRIKNGKDAGEGTGFIIYKNGLIVTNNHVVEDGDDFKVRKTLFLLNGNKVYKEYNAKIVKTNKEHDCALIRIAEEGEEFPYFLLSKNKAEPLEPIIMGGYPLGASRLNNISFNEGKTQSINKDSKFSKEERIVDRIYVDISGVPGSSGSAVINKNSGECIGIYSGASLTRQQNVTSEVSYAMPISYVWELLED